MKKHWMVVGFVSVVAMLVPASAQAALVGSWNFDADNADDSSGNAYHGTLVGGSYSTDTPAALAGGKSLDVTAGNHYVYVDTGGTQDVFDLDRFTVAAWVKGWPGSWNPYISKNGESGGWQMRRHGGNPTLDFTTRGTQPDNGDMEGSSTVVGDGNWHHVAMAVDWDGANLFTKTIYVDGQFSARRTESQNGGDTGIRDTADRLVFGARENGGSFGNYLNGKLDDIHIYDGALGPVQVAHLNAGGDPTALPAASDPVPAPWVSQDIATALPGTTEYVAATDTYIISGDGGDIWDGNDRFRYMHQPADGDFNAVVRLVSQRNTDGWAKAGIMAREELDNNSPFVGVAATPSNQVKLQAFPNQNIGIPGSENSGAAPYWMALIRRGDDWTAKYAPDVGGYPGAWTQATHNQALNAAVNLGLAVTSHTDSQLSTAVFDNVGIGHANALEGSIRIQGAGLAGKAYAVHAVTGDPTGPVKWKVEKFTAFQALRTPDGAPGLKSEWYTDQWLGTAGGTLGLEVTVPQISRDDGVFPAGWTRADDFSVRYTGQLYVPKDGTYVFREHADDEFWMDVDGTQVHHDGSWNTPTTVSLALTEGWHDLEVVFREGGGGDYCYFDWDMGTGGALGTVVTDAELIELLLEGDSLIGSPTADGLFPYSFPMDQIGQTATVRLTVAGLGLDTVTDEFTGQIIPEPATMFLAAMGLAGLGGYIRRRRRA